MVPHREWGLIPKADGGGGGAKIHVGTKLTLECKLLDLALRENDVTKVIVIQKYRRVFLTSTSSQLARSRKKLGVHMHRGHQRSLTLPKEPRRISNACVRLWPRGRLW